MVKAHCVIITAQVDMNLIVVCERIMELQPSKKMNLIIVDAVLEEFEWTYHHLLHYFPDVRSLACSKNRRDTESPVCIVLMREATPIPY